jgi:hypothetical protein
VQTGDVGNSAPTAALLREQKDLLSLEIMALCRRMRIRILAGGGSVLTAQRLISPRVSRTLSLLVDPASSQDLYRALRSEGWRVIRQSRSPRILPPMGRMLVHDEWMAQLVLYAVIPGFFADPETSFDLLWERRRAIPIRGELIAGLDRLASAVLASHNNLGHSELSKHNSDFFAEQVREALDDTEKRELTGLVRRLGAGAEMRDLLDAAGLEPVEFALPSREYVRWRLQVNDVSDQLKRAVALLELPRSGRRDLYDSKSGRPHTSSDWGQTFSSLPGTFGAVLGARRRWASANRD